MYHMLAGIWKYIDESSHLTWLAKLNSLDYTFDIDDVSIHDWINHRPTSVLCLFIYDDAIFLTTLKHIVSLLLLHPVWNKKIGESSIYPQLERKRNSQLGLMRVSFHHLALVLVHYAFLGMQILVSNLFATLYPPLSIIGMLSNNKRSNSISSNICSLKLVLCCLHQLTVFRQMKVLWDGVWFTIIMKDIGGWCRNCFCNCFSLFLVML